MKWARVPAALWALWLVLNSGPSSPAEQEAVVARFFAASTAGPFLSYSWGEHWQTLGHRIPQEIGAFACIGPRVLAGGKTQMFLSDDFGESWSEIPWSGGGVLSFVAATLFAFEPTVFAGTTRGLYRSPDGGRAWNRVGAGVIEAAVNDLAWPGPKLFAASAGGLFLSEDGGENWTSVSAGLPAAPLLSLTLSRFFQADPVLFVGTRGAGLYRSRDGASSFQSVGGEEWKTRTIHDLFWWGPSLFAATDVGLFVSRDAGERWESAAAPLEGEAVLAIAVPAADTPHHSDIIVGTTRGVFKSSDGALSWRHLTEGMGAPRVYGFGSFPFPRENLRPRRKR